MDTFAAPTRPGLEFREFMPRIFPAEKAIRASHREAATRQLGGVSPGQAAARAGLVTGRPGTSESESQVNLCGPRRYSRWREVYRCLKGVVDDGAVSVLFIADFRNSIEESRLNSPWVRLAGRFLEEVPGECVVADLLFFMTLDTGGNSVTIFFWTFLVKMASRKIRCRGVD